MQSAPLRETVDLSVYPDLVVMLLGLRAGSLRSLPVMVSVGRGLAAIQRDKPDGLLSHQSLLYGWNHLGFRQYWRDMHSLERFTRAMPHAGWWKTFLKNPQGCGFWHEMYNATGGMEAVYVNMPARTGFAAFAPMRAPVGPFMTSSGRLRNDADSRASQ